MQTCYPRWSWCPPGLMRMSCAVTSRIGADSRRGLAPSCLCLRTGRGAWSRVCTRHAGTLGATRARLLTTMATPSAAQAIPIP
jgi:hypothetical protein